mgnify:CR=1 FL=1
MTPEMTPECLIDFERQVADLFEAGAIPGPVHLSGGNEEQLIRIFRTIKPRDYVFSTWRNHYHALLKGIPEELVLDQIRQGRSMNLMFPEYRFFTSAIVGGIAPIATGVAMGCNKGEEVWCFIGDMAAETGVVRESMAFADHHLLPINFIVEDNKFSCNSPTAKTTLKHEYRSGYSYERTWPHTGTGNWVTF